MKTIAILFLAILCFACGKERTPTYHIYSGVIIVTHRTGFKDTVHYSIKSVGYPDMELENPYMLSNQMDIILKSFDVMNDLRDTIWGERETISYDALSYKELYQYTKVK